MAARCDRPGCGYYLNDGECYRCQVADRDKKIELLEQECKVYRAGLRIIEAKLEEALKVLEPLVNDESFDGLLKGTHKVVPKANVTVLKT